MPGCFGGQGANWNILGFLGHISNRTGKKSQDLTKSVQNLEAGTSMDWQEKKWK